MQAAGKISQNLALSINAMKNPKAALCSRLRHRFILFPWYSEPAKAAIIPNSAKKAWDIKETQGNETRKEALAAAKIG